MNENRVKFWNEWKARRVFFRTTIQRFSIQCFSSRERKIKIPTIKNSKNSNLTEQKVRRLISRRYDIDFPSLVRFAIPRFRFKGAPCMQMRDEREKNENEWLATPHRTISELARSKLAIASAVSKQINKANDIICIKTIHVKFKVSKNEQI